MDRPALQEKLVFELGLEIETGNEVIQNAAKLYPRLADGITGSPCAQNFSLAHCGPAEQ